MAGKGAAKPSARPDLAAFRGKEPAPGEEHVPDGEVDDGPSPEPGAADDTSPPTRLAEDDAGGETDDAPPAPKAKMVGDDKRKKIYENFRKKQEDSADEVGDGLGPARPKADTEVGTGDEADGKDGKVAAKPIKGAGETDDEADKTPADAIDLLVDGKKLRKSIAEVAVLADLTEDEVKADPERAAKYARRELASLDRLEKSKKILRDTGSRARDLSTEPNDPGRSAAPSQGDKTGQNDGSDQPDDARKPSGDVDFEQLVEDIQIGDPKEIAPKLREALEKLSRSTAEQTLSTGQRDNAINADRRSTASAMQAFLEAHPEVKGQRYMTPAIAAGLYDEYRDDLRSALITEGQDEDTVDTLLAQASNDQIARAHQGRRLLGDANVRTIDKAFLEKAYERVKGELGGTPASPRQQFRETRQGRKDELRTQPKRASVTPAARVVQDGKVDETSLRKSAVASMQKMRGQKIRA